MGETPSRRAAAAAARELLQGKVDRIADLSEAARAADAAIAARAAADRHIAECRENYRQIRRAAIAAGWTKAELDQLGWPPEHGRARRRRPAAARPAEEPAASSAGAPAAPAEGTAASPSGPPLTAQPAGPDGGQGSAPSLPFSAYPAAQSVG